MNNEYQKYLEEIGEYGVVVEVNYPIMFVEGLPKAKLHEVIVFETGEKGEVFSVGRDKLEVMIFSAVPVKTGTNAVRTDDFLKAPIGDGVLGCLMNPLGESMSENNRYIPAETDGFREVDAEVHKLSTREKIREPLYTGVTLVDTMIPLGKGQRELIIGDRKTGKTAFAMSTIKTQVLNESIVIYAGIGKREAEVKQILNFFNREKIMDRIVMVCSTASDSPSLIYVTPFTAMSIAEHFRDQGRDVLVVLDDLSVHARYYREISLLAKRFPGRESYPGDIFYIHAKLVERAGKFNIGENRFASITCLPIIEIVEGDLTGYISTNVMGMTDGHIFFDSNLYSEGRRPAINIPLSVTRVGKQTQTKLKKDITSTLNAFLVQYQKLESYSHFGAELSAEIQSELEKGKVLFDFFDQHYNQITPVPVQILMMGLIWSKHLNNFSKDEIQQIVSTLIDVINNDPVSRKYIEDFTNLQKLKELVEMINKEKEKLFEICKIKTR